jgi:hypothetical protein
MTIPKSKSYKERCPKCFRLLCKRKQIHDDQSTQFIIEIKHRGLLLYTYDATITCPVCGTVVRINGNDGQIGKVINKYYGR